MKYLFKIIIAIIIFMAIVFVGCCKTEDANDKVLEKNDTNTSFSLENLSVPDAYKDVLSDYNEMVKALFSDDFENKVNSGFFKAPNSNLQYEWECMIIDSKKGLKNISLKSFGYSIYDINDDGITELILLREDYFILAIFTINSDKPQLLDAYWYNHKAIILDSGNIFVFNNSSADCFEYEIQTLQKNNNSLMVDETFGCAAGRYYKMLDGKQTFISQYEFDDKLSEYPNVSSDDKKEYMIKCGILFQNNQVDQSEKHKGTVLLCSEAQGDGSSVF